MVNKFCPKKKKIFKEKPGKSTKILLKKKKKKGKKSSGQI